MDKLEYKSIKYFTVDDIEYSINPEFLTNELAWLYAHIDKIIHYRKYNICINDAIYANCAKIKYQQLLIYLRQILVLYTKINEFELGHESEQIIENLEDIEFLNDPIKAFYRKVLIENSAKFMRMFESTINPFFESVDKQVDKQVDEPTDEPTIEITVDSSNITQPVLNPDPFYQNPFYQDPFYQVPFSHDPFYHDPFPQVPFYQNPFPWNVEYYNIMLYAFHIVIIHLDELEFALDK